MSTRAKIEADFAKAEADLARAATNLAKSCTTHAETDVCLPKAFSNLAKEKVDLVKVDAELAKARASCRAARIELDRLNRVAGMPIGYRSEPTHIAHEAELELAPMDRRKSNEHLGRTLERSTVRPTSRQNDDRRFISHFSSQEVSSKDTGVWQSLAWQAAELSTLTLAYLLYYYVDVHLQIVMLPPSVGSLLVG